MTESFAAMAWIITDLARAMTNEALVRFALNCAAPRTRPACASELTAAFARLAGERPFATSVARFADQRLVAAAFTRKASAVVIDRADDIFTNDARTPLVSSSPIAVVIAKEKAKHAHITSRRSPQPRLTSLLI
jgi:hypothetical protein